MPLLTAEVNHLLQDIYVPLSTADEAIEFSRYIRLNWGPIIALLHAPFLLKISTKHWHKKRYARQ